MELTGKQSRCRAGHLTSKYTSRIPASVGKSDCELLKTEADSSHVELTRKPTRRRAGYLTSKTHKQEPSVRGKVRFRTRVPKVDSCHVEFTENPADVEQGTRTSKTQSRNRPSSTDDDMKPPQKQRSPSQVAAPPRFTTWHNHSQQALSTTPRATSRSHAGDPINSLPSNSPAPPSCSATTEC